MKLILHSEPRPPGDEVDGVPRIGIRRFVVRDEHGRELDTSMIAFGQLGLPIAEGFESVRVTGEVPDEVEIVVEHATLDTAADYLMVVVPLEAVSDG